MCRKTLIHYTSCGCQIMVETICFDYIQHTIKQKDRFPCVKMMSDTYVLKTINKNCFLKPGQLLDDGRIFRHGSYRTRLIYEFERDPNGTRRLWEKWRSDNHDKPRERTESMDVNISAGEDKMKIEADGADVDVDDSHKEREPKIREWQEKTKNEKQPRFKMEKQIKKRQPAGKRKIVNHFVDDLSDPRSDDEIIDDDWKLEPKVKIEPGDTVPWSTTPSRSFSDPTVADPNNTAQEMGINTPDNRGLFQGYRANALGATDTYHMPPTTPHSRFNFNPPATGTHTRYTKTNATNKPPKRNPSNSTYTDQTMNLGSPKAKPKTRAQTLAQSEMQISSPECANRSTYNAMSINHDMHSSFWAGHMSSSFEISNEDADADADIEIDNPPPYSAQALSILPAYQTATDTDTDAIGNTEANANTDTKSPNGPSSPGDPCISDISSASGFIGYNSTYGENQGVFGIYASGEGDQRERKKVRVRETEVENETGDVDSAEDDVKMGGE